MKHTVDQAGLAANISSLQNSVKVPRGLWDHNAALTGSLTVWSDQLRCTDFAKIPS